MNLCSVIDPRVNGIAWPALTLLIPVKAELGAGIKPNLRNKAIESMSIDGAKFLDMSRDLTSLAKATPPPFFFP